MASQAVEGFALCTFGGKGSLPQPRPTGVRVACIGAATARAAERAGLVPDVVPLGAALPEQLAREIAAAGPLTGARVLLPRAERARETLREALEALLVGLGRYEGQLRHLRGEAHDD